MICKLIYKNKEESLIPINILFCQKYHQYAQVYIICGIHIKNPEQIYIKDLFFGELIFTKTITHNTKALYFSNTNFKINSNSIIYLDSFSNEIIYDFKSEITLNSESIYSQKQIINKHLPRYLEISHQYISDTNLISKDVIRHEFAHGIGYRRISFQQVDQQYIKSLIENIIITSRQIEMKLLLRYKDIRIGSIIIINKIQYRILYIYHDFLQKITIIKCGIYIEYISFHFCDSITTSESIKKLNSVSIITPGGTENQYSISINPDIQDLFNINDTIISS